MCSHTTIYVGVRRSKYEKLDKALDFAALSQLCKSTIFNKYIEFMFKHGPWWKPDPELEKQVRVCVCVCVCVCVVCVSACVCVCVCVYLFS